MSGILQNDRNYNIVKKSNGKKQVQFSINSEIQYIDSKN